MNENIKEIAWFGEDIKIYARVLDSQYRDNPKLDHFYTEDQNAQFREKWSEHIVWLVRID